MPDDNNQRVTLAVLNSQLETISKKLDKICAIVEDDHDRIIVLETEMKEIVWLRRAVYSLIFGLLANIGGVIYAIALHLQAP